MSGSTRFVMCGLLVALGPAVWAQTDHTMARFGTASVGYWRNDMTVGGKVVNLYVSLAPTWPLSDQMTIYYSGQECTIAWCYEWWPGDTFCGCDWPPTVAFGGTGTFLSAALQISPQGVGQLNLDSSQITITGGASYGDCPGLYLTWTPNGQWHWSESGQFNGETPTDITHAVSFDDDWQATVTGSACSLTLGPQDGATGDLHKSVFNNVSRTPKP